MCSAMRGLAIGGGATVVCLDGVPAGLNSYSSYKHVVPAKDAPMLRVNRVCARSCSHVCMSLRRFLLSRKLR